MTAPLTVDDRILPVSAEQAHELADRLVTAAYAGDAERVSALFDLQKTVIRALGPQSVEDQLDADSLQTVTAAVRRRFELAGLGYSLAQVAQDHSELRLLRETQAGEGRWLALRRNSAEGLEHIDLLLSLNSEGQPVVVDTRLLSTGRLMSEQLREIELLVAVGQQLDVDLSLHNNLTAAQNELVTQHASQIRGAREASAMGRYPDALRLWDRLPDAVRGLMPSQLFEFELALRAHDRERYHSIFTVLEEGYGNDAAMAMPRLKYYLATEQLAEALGAVDALAEHAITDPYFDVIRSNILTDMHNPAAAKEAALRALNSAPDLKDAYWNLVAVSLNQRDFGATANLLLEMREKFSLEYRLEKAPVFAEFVASPYYEKFLRGTVAEPKAARRAERSSKRSRQKRVVASRPRLSAEKEPSLRVERAAQPVMQVRRLDPAPAPGADAAGVATGRAVSQYTDAVQRMAAARVQGHVRSQRGDQSQREEADVEATNAVMNVALGTEF